MKSFNELGIKGPEKSFCGKKIEPDDFLNCNIIVMYFKIELSKFPKPNNPYVLTIQISLNDEKRVIFTGSKGLLDMINQVAAADFPFLTRIVRVKETKEFIFTQPKV